MLLFAQGGDVSVGNPTVEGVTVKAKVAAHGRGDKITVFKYKPKVRYRKKTGHRQPYTDLTIEKITTVKSTKEKTSRSKAKQKSED